MTQETIFTVEASNPLYVKVRWTDAEGRDCWFFAEHDGDQLTKVRPNGFAKYPTVMRRAPGDKRAELLNAGAPAFAHMVLNATRYVRKHKLATQAQAERARIRAERDAQIIAEKAAVVRRLLAGVPTDTLRQRVREALDLDDATLAKFYDDIQNSAV
jgi:hypothetical protein